MPIIKSAKKRVRVASKATARNTKTKRTFRSAIKAFQASLTSGKDAAKTHSAAQSSIDKAVKKGVVHKNKAARKKSQLAKAAKAAGVKTAGTGKKAVKATKPAAKAVAKKAPAKKPAAKKPAAKKTTKK
jgi:small subunit ribosomal protein S20